MTELEMFLLINGIFQTLLCQLVHVKE